MARWQRFTPAGRSLNQGQGGHGGTGKLVFAIREGKTELTIFKGGGYSSGDGLRAAVS